MQIADNIVNLLGLVQVVVDERPRIQGQFLLLGSNHLLDSWAPDDSHIFKNCVMTELRKVIYLESLRQELYFLQTSSGAEIDAVFTARDGKTIFMAEIKASSSIRNADWRTLRRYVAASGDHIGLLIANTAGIERLDDRVWSVPAAWLLG